MQGQPGGLDPDRREQRRRQRGPGPLGGARERTQEQRIPGRLAGDAPAHGRIAPAREQAQRSLRPERLQRELREARRAARRVQEPRRGAAGRAHRHDEQVRPRERSPEEVPHELERGVVGVLHVVEQQGRRALPAEQLEQAADRAARAPAVSRRRVPRHRRLARERRRGRQRVREPGSERRDRARLERRDPVVERLEQPERDVARMVGARPREHEQLPLGRQPGDRRQERRLADPRLPHHDERPPAPLPDVVERLRRHGQLRVAAEHPHVRS